MKTLPIVFLALLVSSCGNSSSSPSGVTSSIAVTLPSVIKTGETAQATATATSTSGAGKTLGSGWQTDTPAVALVSDSGLVTGVSNGLANIYIVSDGVQGSKSLRVVPNYQGQWAGIVAITQATPFPSSAFLFTCAGYLQATALQFSATFTQSGQSLNGQFTVEGLAPSVFVSLIDPDGGTQITSSTITGVYQFVFNWHLIPVTSLNFSSIRGPVNIVRSGSAGILGGCNIDGTILTLTKVSG